VPILLNCNITQVINIITSLHAYGSTEKRWGINPLENGKRAGGGGGGHLRPREYFQKSVIYG
jgi:hypothetical protein